MGQVLGTQGNIDVERNRDECCIHESFEQHYRIMNTLGSGFFSSGQVGITSANIYLCGSEDSPEHKKNSLICTEMSILKRLYQPIPHQGIPCDSQQPVHLSDYEKCFTWNTLELNSGMWLSAKAKSSNAVQPSPPSSALRL